MRIVSSGGGGLTPVAGGGVTFPAGQILAPNGTAGAPVYSFANDPASGFYRLAGGALALVNGVIVGIGDPPDGTTHWTFDTGGVLRPNVDDSYALGNATHRVTTVHVSRTVQFSVPTVPGTPATGFGVLYMKSDKKLYFKNDAALETALF